MGKAFNAHDHRVLDKVLFNFDSRDIKSVFIRDIYKDVFKLRKDMYIDKKVAKKYFCSVHAIRIRADVEACKSMSLWEKEEYEFSYFVHSYYECLILPFMREYLKTRHARKFYKSYFKEAIATINNFKENPDTFSSMSCISNILEVAFRMFYSSNNNKAVKDRERLMIGFFKYLKRNLKHNRGYLHFEITHEKPIKLKNIIDLITIDKVQINNFGDIVFTYRSNVTKALQRIWDHRSEEINGLQKIAKYIFYTAFNVTMSGLFIESFDETSDAYKAIFGNFNPDEGFLTLKNKIIIYFTSNAAVYKVNSMNTENAIKGIDKFIKDLESCLSIIKENDPDRVMSNHLIRHIIRRSDIVDDNYTSLNTMVEYAMIVKTADPSRRKLYAKMAGEIDLLKKSVDSILKFLYENGEVELEKTKEKIADIYKTSKTVSELLFEEKDRLDKVYALKTSKFNVPEVIIDILSKRISQLNGCSFIIPSFYM